MISAGVFLLEVLSKWKKLKHKKIFGLSAILFFVAWVLVFYGSFIEPKILVVEEYDVSVSESAEKEIRAAVLSDIHVGPYKKSKWVKKVVERVNETEPDVVLILGDFIFSSSNQTEMLGPLKNISAKYGTFAVTGNHDYIGFESDKIIKVLERLNVIVLENENVRLLEDEKLVLAGVSDIWFKGDPFEAVSGLLNDDVVLMLSHNPDVVLTKAVDRVDLVLGAHTHGGQVRLPAIGSLAPLPTRLGKKFDKGLFSYKGLPLFITSGVGETGSRARLFNPPEISILNIKY